jgi:hypothetical protein
LSTQDEKARYLELSGHLNSPIAFHPVFARITGSVKAALFLSQSFYWTWIALKLRGNGRFWKSAQEWEAETFLTREEQESCRRQLKGLGILREKYARLEHRMYFCIDLNHLCDLVVREASSPPLALGKKSNRQSGQSRMGDAGKSPISNRESFDWKRTETTTKSRRDFPRDFRPQKSENLEKNQTLSKSRKNRPDARGGNSSELRWRKLRDEITKAAQGKSMEIPRNDEAWNAIALPGPIGSEAFRKTWESRFADWTNQGWPTGKIEFEFWNQCRTYQIPMPEEFQSALVSAMRAEGIPFDFHMAEGLATESTGESNNSSLPTSASKTNHAVASSDFEEE